jgi:DNA-binding beta-propeller fold protein YncE
VNATWQTNKRPGPSKNRAPHGIQLRPGSADELYVNVEVGDSMLVYNSSSGEIERSFPVPAGTHNFIFSAGGDTLFLLSGNSGVFSYDPDTGSQLQHFPAPSPIRGLHYTADGRHLIASGTNEIFLLDPSDLSPFRHFQNLGVQQIIYSIPTSDGRYILAPCPEDGLVLKINVETGAVENRIHTGKAPIYVKIAPEKTTAVVANAMDDHLSIIDIETSAVKSLENMDRPNEFDFVRYQK